MMIDYDKQRTPELAREDAAGGLKAFWRVLVDNRWLILAVAGLVTLAGIIYAASAQPVFESSTTFYVEEPSPNATRNVLSDATSLFETKKATVTEMELLRSRRVISPAVDKLGLQIEAVPKQFPLALPVRPKVDAHGLSEPGLFGYGGYVWGAETIEVPVFDVPQPLLNHTFVITAQEGGRYRLADETGRQWFGMVGRTLLAHSRAGNIELRIARLDGRPGAEFLLKRVPEASLVTTIQKALTVTEVGSQSGIIEVKLRGGDPVRVRDLLNAIGREYLRQTLAHSTEQAERSLAILNARLPLVEREIEQSEEAFNAFRRRHGTVDLGEESKLSLQESFAARAKRAELLQKREELQSRLGERHPLMLGIDRQLATIDSEIGHSTAGITALPQLEQDEQRLTRNIKVNSDLYAEMANTAQQLRTLAASKMSNVRLIDAATASDQPVTPVRPLIVAAAVITGLLLGTFAAFARRALRGGMDSAQRIEYSMGARVVLANIPHSSQQKRLSKQADGRSPGIPLLAKEAPGDPAVEALRGFRAALQFALPNFRNHIVMITGPTSDLGKSFVAANTAAIVAASGRRVLLVDMDLRNGHLHRYFDTDQQNGLCEALTGGAAPAAGIRRGVLENLDFIPTGMWTTRAHKVLMHRDFDAWLKRVSQHYDLVLIDAPPVLAVADAVTIGVSCGAVYLVARAGRTTEEELGESVRRLNQAGISPEGVLFNDGKLMRQAAEYQYLTPKRLGWNA